jgi:hypothetical protein
MFVQRDAITTATRDYWGRKGKEEKSRWEEEGKTCLHTHADEGKRGYAKQNVGKNLIIDCHMKTKAPVQSP